MSECGVGALGGGRWIKVNSCSPSWPPNLVTVAFGLFTRGSGALYGGRSAVPGRGRGYFGAERMRVGLNANEDRRGRVTRISALVFLYDTTNREKVSGTTARLSQIWNRHGNFRPTTTTIYYEVPFLPESGRRHTYLMHHVSQVTVWKHLKDL